MILFAYGHQSLQVIHYVILWIVLSRMVVQRDSFPGCPTQSFFLSLWFSQRVHRQPKALDEPTSGLVGYSETMWDLLPERQHQFRVARNPSRVDATRGDHFLQPTSQDESRHRGRIASGLPTSMISPCQEGKSSPDALRRSACIKFLSASARVRTSRRWFLVD